MPSISFGKRQGFSHIPPDALPKGVVPAFDMGGFAGFLADAPMGFNRKHGRIGVPEIADARTSPVRSGNAAPEPSTGAFAAVADHEGDDLARPAAQRHPKPPFPRPFPHERPDLVELEAVIRLNGQQGRPERRQRPEFFFSHAANARRRRCVRSHAYSDVPERHAKFLLDAPEYSGFSGSRPHLPGSLCTDIADCPTDCGHWRQYSDCRICGTAQ